jgi:simple sugar transport system permease protein
MTQAFQKRSAAQKLSRFLANYAVPIIFIFISAAAIPLSGFSATYLVQELLIRIGRNSFLILSLLIPIMAGMGLNFGMVLGAMAGQIGLVFVSDWAIVGIPGVVLAMIIGTPIAAALGVLCGSVLNRAKGQEMVTSYILGFFINGVYQLVVLYFMGWLIPVGNTALVLSRGYGIRNAISLLGIRTILDRLLPIQIGPIDFHSFHMDVVNIPAATYLVIAAFCFFIVWFRKTKLGQDMRAIGQDMAVADSAGIPVNHTRIIAIVISTVLACYGQIIFLQNMGTLNTYNSHDQAGMFSIAALLIGGASVSRAGIGNVFLGVILFHLMFIVAPMAGKNLMGQAQIGEFFRVFVSYGIIAVALVLHAWKRRSERIDARRNLRGPTAGPASKSASASASKGVA